jgi:hypothetical protein
MLSEKRLAALCAIGGAAVLAAYFVAPFLFNWPFAGASAEALSRYASGHDALFYGGAWLQGTGTLLCVVFFLALVRLSGGRDSIAGLVAIVASAALLALVLVEGAFLSAVPIAAAAGDTATVATAFELSNGVFVRVFPIAPSSATYLALGALLWSSRVLPRQFAIAALAIGGVFELGGVLAIFVGPAAIALAVLAAVQVVWIVSAGVWLWTRG